MDASSNDVNIVIEMNERNLNKENSGEAKFLASWQMSGSEPSDSSDDADANDMNGDKQTDADDGMMMVLGASDGGDHDGGVSEARRKGAEDRTAKVACGEGDGERASECARVPGQRGRRGGRRLVSPAGYYASSLGRGTDQPTIDAYEHEADG